MNLNTFLGSGHPENAPEYRKSNLSNSNPQIESPAATRATTPVLTFGGNFVLQTEFQTEY